MAWRPILRLTHALLWLGALLAVALALALCVAAYGIPGEWVQGRLDAALPADVGRLTVGRLSYRPGGGLVVEGVFLRAPDGRILMRLRRGVVGIRLLSLAPLPDRLDALELDGLYVAQIRYAPDRVVEDTLPPPEARPPFPDLSGLPLPNLRAIPVRLADVDVLDIRAKRIEGRLTAGEGRVHAHGLHGDLSGDGRQAVEGDVLLDFRRAAAEVSLRGFIDNRALDGLWRALDFPLIGEYVANVTLNAPAWGDCTFTVGFNKYDNLFNLRADLVSTEGGAYLGIPFDEAQCTIRCRGIWDAVTEIGPIVARRQGRIAAVGTLRFDCPADRFTFRAEGDGLSPRECLRLIDLPFTELLPELRTQSPPLIRIDGSLPFLSEQTPERVTLRGLVRAPGPGVLDRLPFASAHTAFAMTNGVFALKDLDLRLPHGGSLAGEVSFEIPPAADRAFLSAAVHLADASLADLFAPYGMETLTNCVASGFVDLRGRTDDTFPQSLQAEYDLTVNGGLIRRLPLFAGLTDLLADHIPGVSSFTDSSSARLVGTADAGVFRIPRFTLDGNLLSIEGPAVYDLPNDRLTATVNAGNFKQDTLMGDLTRWATVPVNRFLWRVHVEGPIANPAWRITTILNTVLDKARFWR